MVCLGNPSPWGGSSLPCSSWLALCTPVPSSVGPRLLLPSQTAALRGCGCLWSGGVVGSSCEVGHRTVTEYCPPHVAPEMGTWPEVPQQVCVDVGPHTVLSRSLGASGSAAHVRLVSCNTHRVSSLPTLPAARLRCGSQTRPQAGQVVGPHCACLVTGTWGPLVPTLRSEVTGSSQSRHLGLEIRAEPLGRGGSLRVREQHSPGSLTPETLSRFQGTELMESEVIVAN